MFKRVFNAFNIFKKKKTVRLGIYGSTNAGKTTLANKISIASRELLPNGYLLGEVARALLIAEESFSESVKILQDICNSLGGKTEYNRETGEVKLYLNGTLTTIFLNPNKSYEREWSYDYCDLE